MTVGTIYKI